MRFHVTKDVFNKVDTLQFGLVSVVGADNHKDVPEIDELLSENIKNAEEHFGGKKVKNEPELQEYREAFRSMGINPNRYMCAIEALMTRIAKGQGMHSINPVVDLGNGISLKYTVPIGAHDLDTMKDDEFCVRVSEDGDSFLPFGAEEREPVPAGEVVYATGSHVRTRRWTWRQGDEGMITEDTKDILYIVDGFDDNKDELQKAVDEIADYAGRFLGGSINTGFIDRDNLNFEIEM